MADGIMIDATVATAIGVAFTTGTGAVGWLIKSLWTDRAAAHLVIIDMLKAQFADSTERRTLNEKLAGTVDGLGRKIEDLQRAVTDLVRAKV